MQTDQQLLQYLLNFVTSKPVQCDEIRIVDLYGNKKPSQLFDTTTTNHHHVFTQLKKIKANGKKYNRTIVGGLGTWKETRKSRRVYNKEGSVIGLVRTFCFDENNHVWCMKEYQLSDNVLKDLSGRIRHEEFVVCRIMRSAKLDHNLASSSSQCQGIVESFAQENQDLGIPSEKECSVSVVHQQTPSVSLLAKAEEAECSVRPDNDIAAYYKTLDAYAASILATMVPHIPEPQNNEDDIPFFWEDFNVAPDDL